MLTESEKRENVSIHAPRAGRDLRAGAYRGSLDPFQSTRPARGATAFDEVLPKWCDVSIHAPRAGRDGAPAVAAGGVQSFNPRAPRGARPPYWDKPRKRKLFQSTRPARGAT